MALIKCPECGKEVSDKADSCPECGYPISRKSAPPESSRKNKSKIITAIFVIVLLFFCCEHISAEHKKEKQLRKLFIFQREQSLV